MIVKYNPQRSRQTGILLEKKSFPAFVFSALWLLFLSVLSVGIKAQIPDIRDDLTYLNRMNVNEQVYVHTDCEVYAPGDTIWFRAYIRSKYNFRRSNLSRVFHLDLVNDDGKVISDEKYLITDSQSSGFMVIDNKRPEGFHYLIGYSSWMENFDPELTYRKKILIIKDINKGERIVPTFNKSGYAPGDTVRMMVRYYDDLNNRLEGSRFRYRISAGKDVLARGGAYSDATESSPMELIMPDSLTEAPTLEIWDNTRSGSFVIPVNSGIRIDFFPEGGNCLENIFSIMAFKGVYSNGKPVNLKGIIVDDNGNIITEVKTDHDGMGQFPYQPLEKENYYLKIISPSIPDNIFPLPAGEKNGWAVHANSIGKRLHVEVKHNLPSFDTCLFILSMRGYSDYYRWIRSEAESAFIIPTDNYPAGIAVLTLLDRNRIPLSERLVFINHEKFGMVDLMTNRKKYLCRDSVILDIDLGSAGLLFNEGQYSLTVFDQEFGSSGLLDEPDLISSVYLRPEIKGPINQPDHYFSADNPEIRYHLDLLLLTQGWRKYRYQMLYEQKDTLNYPRNRDLINGNVKRFRFGRDPVPVEGEVNVYFSGNWVKINTDELGHFSILPEYDAEHLSPIVLTAGEDEDANRLILELEEDDFSNNLEAYLSVLSDSSSTPKVGNNYMLEDIGRTLNINTSQSIWLEEVKITRNIRPDTIDVSEELVKSLYDVRAANTDMLASSPDLYQVIMSMGYNCNLDVQNDVLQVYFQGTYETVRFIIDGFDRGTSYLDNNSMYMPNEIESLYLARGYDAFVLYRNSVVIYIKSKFGSGMIGYEDNPVKNYVVIPVLKVSREFYSPEYRTQTERNNPIPDIRKTIYWNPDIVLDEEGKARVVFFNSDRYTKVRCILEGITDEGIPVHGENSYDITIYRE